MKDLGQLIEQLAGAAVVVDPTDLPALAQMHEHLKQVAALAADAAGIDAANREVIKSTASAAEQLVENIVLNEVQNSSAALASVGTAISELQMLTGVWPSQSPQAAPSAKSSPLPAPTPVPQPATAPEQAPRADQPDHAVSADQPDPAINPDDVPLVMEFITESLGHIESAEAAILQLEENPQDQEAINATFRSFHTVKGVSGFLNLRSIGSLAHAAENLLDLARHGKLTVEGGTIDLVLESLDLLKAMITSLDEAVKRNVAPPPNPRLPGILERLHAAATGAPVAAKTAAAAPTGSAPAPAPEPSKPAAESKSHTSTGDATVKVATDRLDSLINMVGELVIAQSMVSQDVHAVANGDQRVIRNITHLGKITRELQDLSMSMRMVPIHGVFQKMARLVRDLARKAGKEIEFVVVGGETELDRNVVEAISDPLVHMVRNSVDHGIEPPDDRVKAGKNRGGRLELKAYHQAGNIVIEITDDGRGLNKAKILKKAIENGIVREGQELSEQEIFKLIFQAGLSTAEKITDISGRGVGMDVVKRNVEALRGRIDIASVEGKGSTFAIRLPLTLAVIDGQIVRVGDHKYIIPITSIEQSIQPRSEQLSSVQNRGEMCMVRGDLLPLFRLYQLFAVQPQNEDPTKALVVIVQDDQRRCCLLVDELLGQQQVVIKSLGESLGHVPGISGGAILGDGNVSLILDVPGLIALACG